MLRLRRLGLAVTLLLMVLAGLLWRSGREARLRKASIASHRADNGTGVGASAWKLAPGERHAPVLVRNGAMTGRIVDDRGAAISGANVCARGHADGLTDDQNHEPACASSGADGSYEITGLLAADYNVDASADGHLPGRYRDSAREQVRVAPGERRTGIDLTLGAGGVELRGRVRDLGGGPVAFARIVVLPGSQMSDDGPAARTKADERGEFRLFVPPGWLSVRASAPGYSFGGKDATAPGAFVEVLLTPESVLVGRVVRAQTGEPVAGAQVDSAPLDWSASGFSATTDAQGKFRIERLAPGRYKPTARTPEGRGRAATSVLLGVGGRSNEVVIELHPAASVTGKVVLADGKTPCPRGSFSLHDLKTEANAESSIGSNGDFQLGGLLPGKYDVRLNCEGHVSDSDIPAVQIAGKSLTGLRYVVQTGQRIRGRVVYPDGSASKGTAVLLDSVGNSPHRQRLPRAETRSDGSFEFAGVPSGNYEATAYGRLGGAASEPTPVSIPAGRGVDGVRLLLPAVHSITGTVVDEDGHPIKQRTVYAESAKGGMWNPTTTRDDGSFTIEELEEGPHKLVVVANQSTLRTPGTTDDNFRPTTVTVKAGTNRPVRLVVERSTSVIAGVVEHAGQPVTDAFVDAERESDSAAAAANSSKRNLRRDWSRAPSLTDGEGRFEITGLAPGRYTVRAFRKGGGDAIAEHVEVVRRANVTLVIAPTGSLAGKVTMSTGGVPESFTLTIEDLVGGFSLTEAYWRTGGRWRADDLPAGNFRVNARSPDATGEITVALAEGKSRIDLAIAIKSTVQVRGQIVALDDNAPVPGLMVTIAAANQTTFTFGGESGRDQRNVTDAQGRFEVDNVPPGKVKIIAFPRGWKHAACGWSTFRGELREGIANDLGTIKCVRQRVKESGRPGDLGFDTKEAEPDPNDPPRVLTVAVVRADGPAAAAGIKVGDVIVSVDGQDVTGNNDHYYEGLVAVSPGTSVVLGLKRGVSVTIKAGEAQ